MNKLLVVLAVTVVGCARASLPSGGAHAHDPSDHNHDRGKMMVATNGPVDALLTAHISSTEGNELDVFVERDGKPLALGTTEILGRAKGHATARDVVFTCAPRDERPADEPDGSCSHFVAKAAWMQPEDALEVETALPLLRGQVGYVWRSFQPLRYAHHIE